jgi:hypothetical protein
MKTRLGIRQERLSRGLRLGASLLRTSEGQPVTLDTAAFRESEQRSACTNFNVIRVGGKACHFEWPVWKA